VLYSTAPATGDGQPPAVEEASSASQTAPLLTEIIRMANDKIQVTSPALTAFHFDAGSTTTESDSADPSPLFPCVSRSPPS